MLQKIAKITGHTFEDSKMEASYQSFRMETEQKLINIANIFSILLSAISFVLIFIDRQDNLPLRIGTFVAAVVGAVINIKFHWLSKMILLLTSLLAFYFIMNRINVLMPSCLPEGIYLIGNAYGLIEVVVTLSISSIPLRITFTLCSFIMKLIFLREGLVINAVLRIVGSSFVFICYYLYFETLARKNYRLIYESREKLIKFQSLLSNDFPDGVVILSEKIDSVLYSNNFFKNMLGPNFDQSSVLCVLDKFYVESCSPLPGIKLQAKKSLSKFICMSLSELPLLEKEIITLLTIFSDTPQGMNNNSSLYYEIKLQKIEWDSKPSYALIFHDVSDKQLVSALKIADEQKDRVIATVSHELRTPINGILGMLEIVVSKIVDIASQKYLNYCKSCSKLLLYLVNSILDLSQIRHNKLKIVKNYFKLDEVFDEIKSLYAFQADQKNITFTITPKGDLPASIYSDKYRLIEILINLLGNAFKFTSKGKISLIVYQNILNKNKICFSVTDTGIGIKEEDKPKLFQVFGKLKQEDKNLNAHGAGLGLTIANELVGMLNDAGGNEKLKFDSEYGKGTTFYFNLPISENSSSESISGELEDDEKDSFKIQPNDELRFDSEISMQKWESLCYPSLLSKKLINFSDKRIRTGTTPVNTDHSSSPFRLKRILVVDDNPFNILAVTFILEKLSFKVSKAMSGEECLQVLSESVNTEQLFDLVLMDIQMPIMDGLETSRIINTRIKEGLLYNVPIVALSANENNDKDICAYKECGMVEYLHKPLRENELETVLAKWVHKRR